MTRRRSDLNASRFVRKKISLDHWRARCQKSKSVNFLTPAMRVTWEMGEDGLSLTHCNAKYQVPSTKYSVLRKRLLRQQLLHHMPMHIRQPKMPTLILIRQTLMINPQQMQNRGVEIVNVNTVLNHIVTVLIRRTV